MYLLFFRHFIILVFFIEIHQFLRELQPLIYSIQFTYCGILNLIIWETINETKESNFYPIRSLIFDAVLI